MGADAATGLATERTWLAYERTLLAWTRTTVSLITFGFGIDEFFRRSRGAAGEKRGLLGPREVGLMMISIGLLSLFLAVLQNRKEVNRLRAEYPRVPRSSARLLPGLIAVLGLAALLGTLLRSP